MNKFVKGLFLGIIVTCLVAASAWAVPFRTPQENVENPALQEDSLQTILDNMVGADTLAAVGDQRDIGVWMDVDTGSTAFAIATFTTNGGALGLYNSAGTEITLGAWSMGADPVTSGDVISGSVLTNFQATSAGLMVNSSLVDSGDWSGFGFFWDSAVTDSVYTEDSKNGDTAEALAYMVEDGTQVTLDTYWDFSWDPTTATGNNDWIIAFDNASNNQDFNDGVFYIKDISAPVPEPATMLLFGMGLLGLAGITRKRTKY